MFGVFTSTMQTNLCIVLFLCKNLSDIKVFPVDFHLVSKPNQFVIPRKMLLKGVLNTI